MAQQEAKNNEGMPAIYAIAEVLREWLSDNNQPGLDDASMHAQMIRKQKDQAKQKEVRSSVVLLVVAYKGEKEKEIRRRDSRRQKRACGDEGKVMEVEDNERGRKKQIEVK